jgi:hypothetical protein
VVPDAGTSSEGPRFTFGFETLKAALGEAMGEPLEDEHGVDDSCDTQQTTTTGLAYWSCATGVVSFAAYPDGLHHWAFMNGLVLEWYADDAAVPDGTPAYAAGVDTAGLAACAEVNDVATACPLFPGATVLGVIPSPGDNRVYYFDQPLARASVHADLTQLPADYDLYLVDAFGTVLLESQSEGRAPESLAGVLPTGSYLLYVHSDPGRDVDPEAPFQLRLDIMTAPRIDALAP